MSHVLVVGSGGGAQDGGLSVVVRMLLKILECQLLSCPKRSVLRASGHCCRGWTSTPRATANRTVGHRPTTVRPAAGPLLESGMRILHFASCHFHISDTSPRSFAGWVSSFKARRIIPVTLPESHKSNNLENLSPYAALFFRKTQVSVCAGDVHQRMHTSTEHTPRPSCYTKAHPRPQRSSTPEGRQSRTTASPLARDPSRRPRGVPRWDFPNVTVVRSLPVQF